MKPPARQRCTEEYNIKMDIKGTGWEDINVRDIYFYGAVTKVVMKHVFPK